MVRSISSLCLLLLLAVSSNGQTTNYLMNAYDSAMDLHHTFEMYVENYQKSLAVEISDFGLYFTDAMTAAIARASTAAQGSALQSCAATATEKTHTAIDLFLAPLENLQEVSTRLHQSVWQQLIETNLKEEDVELFYYYHNYRVQDAYNNLYDVLLEDLYNELYSLWAKYFTILAEMEDCIDLALA